jgi:hypothetical protein
MFSVYGECLKKPKKSCMSPCSWNRYGFLKKNKKTGELRPHHKWACGPPRGRGGGYGKGKPERGPDQVQRERKRVWDGTLHATSTGLTRRQLAMSKTVPGKIVSRKRQQAAIQLKRFR